jgi:hypothetical protein
LVYEYWVINWLHNWKSLDLTNKFDKYNSNQFKTLFNSVISGFFESSNNSIVLKPSGKSEILIISGKIFLIIIFESNKIVFVLKFNNLKKYFGNIIYSLFKLKIKLSLLL